MTPEMYRNAKHLVTHSENFEKDCDYFFCQLSDTFDWYKTLDTFRKIAILALALLLGWKNFIALSQLISFLSHENYQDAAKEIQDKGFTYIANVIASGNINLQN